MKKYNTSDRLKEIMRTRNLKQVDILQKCEPYCNKYGVKLNKNDLSQYVSGKATPKQDKLSILGMALNVSEVWLMGYDVPETQRAAPDCFGGSVSELSDKETMLLKNYRSLNSLGKRKLLEYSEDLMSNPSNIDASSEENLA